MAARVARRVDLLVVTSKKLRQDAQMQLGLREDQVLYAPLGPFNEIHVHDKRESREALGLPLDAAIACYSGKMIEDQTEFLLRTAGELRDIPGFRLLLVGGNPRIDAWTRGRAQDLGVADLVIAPGFVEPPQVELYQAAADVLVFHMSEALPHYDYCTPAKGFEYQAARRPIVATDIPLFEEVFGTDGERAIRVRDRTPAALARGIAAALSLEDEGRDMTRRAADWVSQRTWRSRVDAVLAALESE
jgi:glycosyltransferase involved in cell wall biosynthesis